MEALRGLPLFVEEGSCRNSNDDFMCHRNISSRGKHEKEETIGMAHVIEVMKAIESFSGKDEKNSSGK